MQRRALTVLICCLLAALSCATYASDALLLDHWAYTALTELKAAGFLPEYPEDWIANGHPLTRYECAFYIRAALLRLERQDGKTGEPLLPTLTELALNRLIAEFAPELRALGVNVEPWTGGASESTFIDLDNYLAALTGTQPGSSGAGGGDPPDKPIDLATSGNTYQSHLPEPFAISLTDFRTQDSLVSLAGEVLGLTWTIDLTPGSPQEVLGMPLHVGEFMISSEATGFLNGLDLNISDQLGTNFDAFWFLDLDQAQVAMDRLLLDVKTQVDLSENSSLFGSLSLEYRLHDLSSSAISSQASAGLRVALGDEYYLFAEYTLTNPFGNNLPRWQGPVVGLSHADVGLLLLGLQTMSLTSWDNMELTGIFIYRF